MGRRLLTMRLHMPSCDLAEIEERLDLVELLKDNKDLRKSGSKCQMSAEYYLLLSPSLPLFL